MLIYDLGYTKYDPSTSCAAQASRSHQGCADESGEQQRLADPESSGRAKWLIPSMLSLLAVLTAVPHASAIPYYARKYGTNCTRCHVLPPMLNEFGQRFIANGYRLPELVRKTSEFPQATPISAWNTYRVEANQTGDWAKGYPNRVELISSDSVTPWLSYFVEWRTLSYQTTSGGRLRNRSGRFEDMFVTFSAPKNVSVSVGQFRMINQWDVSRRLTLSTPRTFGAGVSGEASAGSSRLTSLRTFSWAGRAPAVRATWNAKPGEGEADGWFHELTVPFSGEFSAPQKWICQQQSRNREVAIPSPHRPEVHLGPSAAPHHGSNSPEGPHPAKAGRAPG